MQPCTYDMTSDKVLHDAGRKGCIRDQCTFNSVGKDKREASALYITDVVHQFKSSFSLKSMMVSKLCIKYTFNSSHAKK